MKSIRSVTPCCHFYILGKITPSSILLYKLGWKLTSLFWLSNTLDCFSSNVTKSIKARVLSACCSGAQRCVLAQRHRGKTSAVNLDNCCCSSTWGGLKVICKTSEVSHTTVRNIVHMSENLQDSCLSSMKWICQQVHPKIRLCNAQRNDKPQECHLRRYKLIAG